MAQTGLSRGGFHARTSVSPEKAQELPERGLVFGLSIGDLLEIYDRDSQSWKMSGSLFGGDYAKSSGALLKSGMMRNGRIYAQETWVQSTKGKENGLSRIREREREREASDSEGKCYRGIIRDDNETEGENRDWIFKSISGCNLQNEIFNTESIRCGGSVKEQSQGCIWIKQQKAPAERRSLRQPEQCYRKTKSTVCRVSDGIPSRVDRLRGLGNAIVPQIAELLFNQIKPLI
jgi:hypothetical protein